MMHSSILSLYLCSHSCLSCVYDMATVSQSPPLPPPLWWSLRLLSCSSSFLPLSSLSLPLSFSLFLPLPETLNTNKGADLLIWGLCGCCLEGCVFVCASKWLWVCAHVCLCVFHRFKGGWMEGVAGEIYLSEQRRNGNREERGEGCAEKKKSNLKEKGRKREIYCKVRMEHIKKESQKSDKRNEGAMQNGVSEMQNTHYSTCIYHNYNDSVIRKFIFSHTGLQKH